MLRDFGSSPWSTCRSRCSACSRCCPRCSCWPSGAPRGGRARRSESRPGPRSGRARVRSGWLVGAVAVVVLAYISYKPLRTDAGQPARAPAGAALAAVRCSPLSSSDVDADANIATHADKRRGGRAAGLRGARRADPQRVRARGARPGRARVHGDRVGPVRRQVDVFDRVARDFPDVEFAAVSVRGDRHDLDERGAVARLEDPGRPRPRRAPSRRSTASSSARSSCSRTRAARSSGPRSSSSTRPAARRRPRARVRAAAAVTDATRSSSPPRWIPLVAEEHPGMRVWSAAVAARPGPHPRASYATASRRLRPLARRAGASPAHAAGPVGVPRALPPPRPRPGRDAHAGRGARARAHARRRLLLPRAAGRRARARHAGDRRAGPSRSTPRRSRAASSAASTRAAGSSSADAAGPIAPLFSPPGEAHAPDRRTTAMHLVAVQAPGVEDIYVEEAVWTAASAPTMGALMNARASSRSAPSSAGWRSRRPPGGGRRPAPPLRVSAPSRSSRARTRSSSRRTRSAPGRRLDRRVPPNLKRPDGSVPRVDVIHLHHGVWIVNGRRVWPPARRRPTRSHRPATAGATARRTTGP
jgi:hypothetical protein